VRHAIRLAEPARNDVERLRAFHSRPILNATRTHLEYQPLVATGAKKPLRAESMAGLIELIDEVFPDGGSISEPWELRVLGRWRVIYVVTLAVESVVHVLRIFEKPVHLDLATALARWDRLE